MRFLTYTLLITLVLTIASCTGSNNKNNRSKMEPVKIIFLHHSTGNNIWMGGRILPKNKTIKKLRAIIPVKSRVSEWFRDYNREQGKNYQITDQFFPKAEPYGWHNYPYDYYNIWVAHAGDQPYMEEPSLKILIKKYDVIIWKHCFPVSNILPDDSIPDIDSEKKTLGNYKLQYLALKKKMHEFPETRFIVWTGAALIKNAITKDKAERAKNFFDWVRNEWDEPGDNIYLWDFYQLETDGGLYMKDEYASGKTDSHPNPSFSEKVYPLFCQRIVDVIETGGEKTTLTGIFK